jgi:hypothetical protein
MRSLSLSSGSLISPKIHASAADGAAPPLRGHGFFWVTRGDFRQGVQEVFEVMSGSACGSRKYLGDLHVQFQ